MSETEKNAILLWYPEWKFREVYGQLEVQIA